MIIIISIIILINILVLVYYFLYDIITINVYNKIPKRIIQTWNTDNIPTKYNKLINKIKTQNPDYEYLFFTDTNIVEFLKTNYPDYLITYNKLPIKIQKIDFFRYIVIYHYGGIYMDLDMNGLKNMNSLLRYSAVFPIDEYITNEMKNIDRYNYFYNNNQKFLLGQYAFAANKKHPFIKQLIDNIHLNINKIIKLVDHNNDNYVYNTTGPDYISKQYMDYNDKSNITILDNGKRQYFGDYAQHLYFGSWK